MAIRDPCDRIYIYIYICIYFTLHEGPAASKDTTCHSWGILISKSHPQHFRNRGPFIVGPISGQASINSPANGWGDQGCPKSAWLKMHDTASSVVLIVNQCHLFAIYRVLSLYPSHVQGGTIAQVIDFCEENATPEQAASLVREFTPEPCGSQKLRAWPHERE